MTATKQVCLVSEDTVPILTPVLDHSQNTTDVHLVSTVEFQENCEYISKILKPRGLSISTTLIENDWDIEQVRNVFMTIADEQEKRQPSQPIALNASGGTRPLVLAATEVFIAYQFPVFCVRPETDTLVWIYPNDRASEPLQDHIKIDEYLASQGVEIHKYRRDRFPENLQRLGDSLIANQARFEKGMGSLNWAAMKAEDNYSLTSPNLSPNTLDDDNFQEIIDLFADAGLLKKRGSSLKFTDEHSRFICGGGWLEVAIFTVLRDLRNELSIQDIAHDIDIVRKSPRGDDVENQLDIAFISNNRFFIIECKTRRIIVANHDDGMGAETLYKLDTLRDAIADYRTSGLLVSYRTVPDRDLKRASTLDIKVCYGSQLSDLRSHLVQWVRNA